MSAVTEINRHGRPHEIPEGQVPGQWQALMTLLERRFPDRWGRRERVQHTGKDDGPIEQTFTLRVIRADDEEAADGSTAGT